MLVVLAEQFDVGCVVEGDDEGVAPDPNVALQSREELLGKMRGIPIAHRGPQALAKLMEGRLGDEGQAHMAVADIQVEGTRSIPSEGLMVLEELLDMPSVRVILGQRLDFVASAGAQEGLEEVVGSADTGALKKLDQGEIRAVVEVKGALQGRESRPLFGEGELGQDRSLGGGSLAGGHGRQEIEAALADHRFEEFTGAMFLVGEDKWPGLLFGLGVQNLGGHGQNLLSGVGGGRGRRGEGEAEGLMGPAIHQEEGLRHLASPFLGAEAVAAHLTLAVTDQAMGIEGQQGGVEMLRGPAQLAQGNLQLLGLLHGVMIEEFVDGRVGGYEGQTVGEFESFLGEGAAAAHRTEAQGRFVDEMEGESGFEMRARLASPGAEQIPSAQPQQFGHQEPDADLIAGNLVRQELADLMLEGLGMAGFVAPGALGALGWNEPRRVGGIKCVEFFFAGRSRR